ncbi:unnamed protein product [Effrenium voratum]|nr:unnamed protein product [Effrenium voratum]
MRRIAVALSASVLSGAGASSGGSVECPCVVNGSSAFEELTAGLTALGIDVNYGLNGCQAYDANFSLFGCESNEGLHCLSPWCWVDMSQCPLDAAQCAAEGGVEGSRTSPHCRTRPYTQSPSLQGINVSAFYSYETCGSVNSYSATRLFDQVGGKTILAAATPFSPWLLTKTNSLGQEVFAGPLYDFFVSALRLIEPQPNLQILPGWATQQSRAVFPASSYTACVHDVAVGNFDVCIADLWLTPARHQLTTFSPALRQDYFYLVVPARLEEVTWWSRLLRPFLPFTVSGWAGVGFFLCGMSVLLFLAQHYEEGCPRPNCRSGWRTGLAELGRSFFNVWHDFLLGQSTVEVETRSNAQKFFSLGFSFFVLVTLASYTASLASMLVVQRKAVGTIGSMDDAIAQQVPVCVAGALMETFTQMYPRARIVDSVAIELTPRALHAGKCGAMILSQDVINLLQSGDIQRQDCAAVQSGEITEDEGRCQTDHLGNDRDDCTFLQVGNLLWSVPIALPLSERVAHSLSWALTFGLARGLWQEALMLNANAFPKSQCEEEVERSEMDGLDFSDLGGTIVLSAIIVGLGLLCCLGQRVGASRQKTCDGDIEKMDPPEEVVFQRVCVPKISHPEGTSLS